MNQRVLIVGGGLGGLALAQGLRLAKRAIKFHVFERDLKCHHRAQGYRIRISPDGAEALRKLLSDAQWKTFEASCATMKHGGNKIDAETGEAQEWVTSRAPSRSETNKAYNADRAVLRDILLSGLTEQHISYGKRFVGYDIESDGTVQAHFTDGSTERGGLLIGADGIRSDVRRLLLPDLAVLDTETRAIFGKTPTTSQTQRRYPEQIANGICLISQPGNSKVKLFCDIMTWDAFKAAELPVPVTVPPEYVYWVFCFRNDALGEQFSHRYTVNAIDAMKGDLSLETIQQLAADWSKNILGIMDDVSPNLLSTLNFLTTSEASFSREWERLRQWRAAGNPYPVTLLGDAAHPTPPLGGVGANAAFQEAFDLCQMLMEENNVSSGLTEAAAAYEALMLLRAKPVLLRHESGAGSLLGIKPFDQLKLAPI